MIWLERLEEEHDNLRAALAWCQMPEADGGAEAGLRLVGALQEFWYARGEFDEGRQWCRAVLSRPDAQGQTRARARALSAASMMADSQRDYATYGLTKRRAFRSAGRWGRNGTCSSPLLSLGTVGPFSR